jgi:hypothetical protein
MLAQLSPRAAGIFVKFPRQIPEPESWLFSAAQRLPPELSELGLTAGSAALLASFERSGTFQPVASSFPFESLQQPHPANRKSRAELLSVTDEHRKSTDAELCGGLRSFRVLR